jgi:hypothetical protein
MSNQIQSSNEMQKLLDPEASSGLGSAKPQCHSERWTDEDQVCFKITLEL